jgi:hypothetical protein
MKALFDIHCHIMTLARFCLGPFIDVAAEHSIESIYSQVAAPGFLLLSLLRNGGQAMRNVLSVVENDPGGMIRLMEDDLAGAFGRADELHRLPLVSGNGLELLGETWEGWVICPLVMDFSRTHGDQPDIYYARPSRKPIAENVREILAGISGYRRERPAGRFIIRPFLGIDPGSMTLRETETMLHHYFGGYAGSERSQLAAFRATARWKGDPAKPPRNAFAGIKLYPPMGFDPWPDPAEARDKVRLLYGFAEKRRIPITVHCDDQGYRTIALSASHRHTEPGRWHDILAEFPDLIVNFAHFGQRYLALGDEKNAWSRTIMDMMVRWPGVHADVSFNGGDAGYWETIARLLDALPAAEVDQVRQRLLFGTDFYLCLGKTRSYLDYVRDFSESALDSGLKRAMLHDNPARFLFGS